MRSEWRTVPLGSVTKNCNVRRVPVREADRKPGPYPYYGASGVIDHVEGYLFDGDYLLIAEDGDNLLSRNTPVAFMASGKFWVNNHAHIVQGNEHAISEYLCYWFAANDISGYVTGSAQPKLTQDALNRMPVELPPLGEQRAIAGVLGALDDKIAANRRLGRTLEALGRAVFRSWFVDFDPVTARAAGRRPVGMTAAVADLFPAAFADSPLGPIPEEWCVGTLY